jgi:SNF2 family DNA or RNA helicase
MILDYNNKNNQLVIIEENKEENFIDISGSSGFSLQPRMNDDNYQIPFIALPMILKTLKKLKYNFTWSSNLKKFYKKHKNYRKYLTDLKAKEYDKNDKKVYHILSFIKDLELQIKQRYGESFSFYGNQIITAVYAIIAKRIIIGNDIGTGKSLTSMIILKYLKKYNHINNCLIMMPPTLVKNFYNDYKKFFGDNQVIKITTETAKKRSSLYQTFKNSNHYCTLMTNYEKCRVDYKELKQLNFELIIVDEFHKMRNFFGKTAASMSRNFFKMVRENWKPTYRIPMSGTPIENKIFDLYPIFKFLDDGKILGGKKFFENNFIVYKEYEYCFKPKNSAMLRWATKREPEGFKHHSYIKNIISPYIIKKKLDLPVKCYKNDILIKPSKSFKTAYNLVKCQLQKGVSRYVGLRQFLCDTERHGIKENPKYEHLRNIITQTREKVVIFSFFKCSIRRLKKVLNKMGYSCITCMGDDGKDPFDIIKEFEKSDSQILLTTDKINYGHNIQFAKILIEWEKPIKPNISMQRIGRLYRSGQDKDVHVYSFVVEDTVEFIIYQNWLRKKDLIDKVIESLGTNAIDDKIEDMFKQLERDIKKDIKIHLNS